MQLFISGIGGAGLGPLAEIALDAGISVVGSDAKKSLQTDELEKRGVQISYQQTRRAIAMVHAKTPIDWFVYTSALPDDAPELEFARENRIRVSKRDDFLAELINKKNQKLIAVAGTHGKTTTTAMLIWAFQQLGLPVSYSVGTTLPFGASGSFDSESEFFIYEADEYDRNFLKFWPECSLVVSLDYDHADTYPTQANYNSAFRQFINQSRHTVMWRKSAEQLNLPEKINLTTLDGVISRREIDLPGEKMRANAYLAMKTLQLLIPDVKEAEIQKILAEFPGTSRRFEKLAENLYTDYAHHPAEISATIEKALELSPKVAAVYQPHQNLRQHEISKKGGYGESFDGSSKIFWIPTYLVRSDLIKNAARVLAPKDLISRLSADSQPNAIAAELNDKLWDEILNLRHDGYLVIIMGAGPIDGWARQKLSKA